MDGLGRVGDRFASRRMDELPDDCTPVGVLVVLVRERGGAVPLDEVDELVPRGESVEVQATFGREG